MMKNKKSLGQHWLKNRVVLEKIADLAVNGVGNDSLDEESGAYENSEKTEIDTCVEIGPGLGFLTSSLLKRFDRVVAVEYDADLARKLPGSFPGKNLEVVNEDILKYDWGQMNGEYVVVGNIPYYITSPIIEKVLTSVPLPQRVVLLMQKEVAERILAKRETVLSLFVKNRARVWAGPAVPAGEFTPSPKVDSQVVVFEPLAQPVVKEAVFDLIRRGFVSPRKKLVHNLVGMGVDKEKIGQILMEIGVSPDVRPGDLSLANWAELNRALFGGADAT